MPAAGRSRAIFSLPRSVISNLMAIAPAAYRATCRVAFFVFFPEDTLRPAGRAGRRNCRRAFQPGKCEPGA